MTESLLSYSILYWILSAMGPTSPPASANAHLRILFLSFGSVLQHSHSSNFLSLFPIVQHKTSCNQRPLHSANCSNWINCMDNCNFANIALQIIVYMRIIINLKWFEMCYWINKRRLLQFIRKIIAFDKFHPSRCRHCLFNQLLNYG